MAQSQIGLPTGIPSSGLTDTEQQLVTDVVERILTDRHIARGEKAITPPDPLVTARRLYAERRARDRFFEPFVLERGAWEILLEIYIHTEQGMTVPVSSACLGTGIPQSTALRRITEMEAAKLLRRIPDQRDRRRHFLVLSKHAVASMRSYLSQVCIE